MDFEAFLGYLKLFETQNIAMNFNLSQLSVFKFFGLFWYRFGFKTDPKPYVSNDDLPKSFELKIPTFRKNDCSPTWFANSYIY